MSSNRRGGDGGDLNPWGLGLLGASTKIGSPSLTKMQVPEMAEAPKRPMTWQDLQKSGSQFPYFLVGKC